VQDPNIFLTILSSMAQKPEVKFDKLFQKLYNMELWVMAYESIAANPGNMTPGSDGKTIDGASLKMAEDLIAQLKSSTYTPTPVRREYVPKSNGGMRPIGIPSFEDKWLQTVVKFILEAIYEPTFSNHSHGFRPKRSCHTALQEVKQLVGIRWWVEGDIKGFFDNLDHDTLLGILGKRITDQRFIHLISQFLRVGYIENWEFHKTYSGTPQGSNLSPILANIYLNELDQMMESKVKAFNQGKLRRIRSEYRKIQRQKREAKKQAQQTGDWSTYKALRKQLLSTQAGDPVDANYRRLYFIRYADDFLIGVIGSKADAQGIKEEVGEFLKTELKLELSAEKTLITHATKRVRFLGYDIKRWPGKRAKREHSQAYGTRIRKGASHQLALLIPRDKVQKFAKTYGSIDTWRGNHRNGLVRFSELEIMMIYNSEVRGFLNYYSLADNLSAVGARILWLTTGSFFRTLAKKRKSTLSKVAKSMKQGPRRFVITLDKANGETREYELLASTRQLKRDKIDHDKVDLIPNTWRYKQRNELGKRLLANECEWCGTQEGRMEVHHVRKLKDLKGKAVWEKYMLARRRKTLVLCQRCHIDLHAGRLTEKTKKSS